MAPEPPAPAKKGAKGKPLSLKSPWTWVIIGGIALAGGAYLLWRRSQTAASTASTTGTDTGTNDSGALGTLQDEIGNLQSAAGAGSGGGTSVVPVTTPSGGSGTTTSTGTGPSTGDTTSSGTASSGGGTTTSSGGGTTTTTAAPPKAAAPTVTNGRVVSVSNNRATVAWDGPGATQWAVTRVGPGSPNGITNIVGVPQAVYTGLASGHNYEITIQPLVGGKPAGSSGRIDFKTT